jgi:hypothetical protein
MDTVLFLDAAKREGADVCFDLEFRKARERTPSTRSDFREVRVALIGNVWEYEEAGAKRKKSPSPAALKFLDALNSALVDTSEIVAGRKVANIDAWKNECVRLGLIDKES